VTAEALGLVRVVKGGQLLPTACNVELLWPNRWRVTCVRCGHRSRPREKLSHALADNERHAWLTGGCLTSVVRSSRGYPRLPEVVRIEAQRRRMERQRERSKVRDSRRVRQRAVRHTTEGRSMNRVELKGTLTKDAEFRFLQSGSALGECTVAVNGSRWDGERREHVVTTLYVAVQIWDQIAEHLMSEYEGLDRGDEVYVVGELDQREFEKRDGTKDRKTRVRAHTVTVVRRRRTTQAPTQVASDAPSDAQTADPWR
jgi:single stranded DNA-binding protein